MPEYLAPGVYVEETSFRAKSIEGVSTSICGMIGPTRFGPVGGDPLLVTSYPEYERYFGGIDGLEHVDEAGDPQASVRNYMGFAARAFFDNGGTKLYVARIFAEPDGAGDGYGYASADLPLGASPPDLRLAARFPGGGGNLRVRLQARTSGNLLFRARDGSPAAPAIRNIREGDVVFIGRGFAGSPPASPAAASGFFAVERDTDGDLVLASGSAQDIDLADLASSDLDPDADVVYLVTVLVSAEGPGRFDQDVAYGEFGFAAHREDSLSSYFRRYPESTRRRLTLPVEFSWPGAPDEYDASGGPNAWRVAEVLFPDLAAALQAERETESRADATAAELRDARLAATRAMAVEIDLSGGHDGLSPSAIDYEGREVGNLKTGLVALTDQEDVSMVAAPGYSALYADSDTVSEADAIQAALIGHAERMRYRIAVLDSGPDMALSDVRDQRGKIDSKYGALYYPWLRVLDPLAQRGATGADKELLLPPSGAVCGIYARNDVERGVHKAPANEVVRGVVGLEFVLNKAQQDVLNPEGINCFRFFEGRGYRLWGARTISSDPEWKYVNVRRYFLYLERSIEKGTQWVVFENNSEALWANVRRTVEDFLFTEWNNGALMGLKPEEAYFVRCDRSTMTQNDIDNGRLICLIGVAPVKPAEFVIFRIGQWTADKKS